MFKLRDGLNEGTACHPGITGGGQSHVLQSSRCVARKQQVTQQCLINPIYIKQNTVYIFLTVKHFRQNKDKRKKVITIHKPPSRGTDLTFGRIFF